MTLPIAPGQTQPSARDSLNVAVAGLGFMGLTHLKAWKQLPTARLCAVMDMSETRLTGDLSSVGGNLGVAGEKFDFSALRRYRSLEALLADREVDAVDICLPTNEHADATVAALRAHKHVLVEKPLARNEEETKRILAEHKRSGCTLMTAQVLRFSPAYVALGDALNGAGRVHSAVFRRRCAAPTWSGWLTDPSRSGGGIFDLLIHDVDYCVSRWGMPASVRAVGHEDLAHGIDVVHAELQYPGSGPVIVTGGWHHPGAFPFSMEFTVVTDKCTFEWTNGAPQLHAYGTDTECTNRELPGDDAFAAEIGYFADCVIQGRLPERCPPEESAQSILLVHRIIESRKRNGESIRCKS